MHKYDWLIFDKGARAIQWKNDSFFSISGAGTVEYPLAKKKILKAVYPHTLYRNEFKMDYELKCKI